jgi:hypothetical protein
MVLFIPALLVFPIVVPEFGKETLAALLGTVARLMSCRRARIKMTSRIGLTRRCNEPLAAMTLIEIRPHAWGLESF